MVSKSRQQQVNNLLATIGQSTLRKSIQQKADNILKWTNWHKLRRYRRDVLSSDARWGKTLEHTQLRYSWDRTHCILTRYQIFPSRARPTTLSILVNIPTYFVVQKLHYKSISWALAFQDKGIKDTNYKISCI